MFKDGKVQKVPATPGEALNSSLMGFFEKRKFRNFLIFVNAYDIEKPSTYFQGDYDPPSLVLHLQYIRHTCQDSYFRYPFTNFPLSSILINLFPICPWLAGKIPLHQVTAKQLYDEFGLDDNTRAFTGHAMALHTDDDYIGKVRLPPPSCRSFRQLTPHRFSHSLPSLSPCNSS